MYGDRKTAMNKLTLIIGQIIIIAVIALLIVTGCMAARVASPQPIVITTYTPYEILAVEEYTSHVKVYLFTPVTTEVSEDWDAALNVRDQVFKKEKTAVVAIVGKPSQFFQWYLEDESIIYWIWFRYPPREHPFGG